MAEDPIRALSADGVYHEFPAGTDLDVVDRVMKGYAESLKPQEPEVPSGTAKGIAKALGQGALALPGELTKAGGAMTQAAGVAVKSAAENAQDLTRAQRGIMDRIDAGEAVKPTDDPMGYADANAEQRHSMRVKLENDLMRMKPAGETGLGAAGDAIKSVGRDITGAGQRATDWADRTVPLTDEEKSRETVQIAQGLTKILPYMAAGAVGGAPGVIAYGAVDTFGRTFEDAKKSGASDEDASVAAAINGVLGGGMNAVPPLQALKFAKTIPDAFKGKFVQTLTESVKSGATFTGFAEVTKVVDNLVAKEGYDPTRAPTRDVGEGMGVSFATGAILPVAGAAMSVRRRSPTETVKPVLEAESVDQAIVEARNVVEGAPVDVTAFANEARKYGNRADQEQAQLLELFGGLNRGDVIRSDDGTFAYRTTDEAGKDTTIPLKVWDQITPREEGAPATVTPDLVAAQRDHYEKMGVRVVYFENDPAIPFDGAVSPENPNTIFLSNDPSRNAAQVGAHELTHVLESTVLPDGKSVADVLHGQVMEGMTSEGWRVANERFGAGVPERAAFPEGREGDSAHADATLRHLVTEMGADIGGEAPKFQGFVSKVTDAVEARYGVDAAKGVVRQMIDGIQNAMRTLREMFFRPAEGAGYGQPDTVSQRWVTNLEDIHRTLADSYAERFGSQAEKENASLRAMRDSTERDRLARPPEGPPVADAAPVAPEGVAAPALPERLPLGNEPAFAESLRKVRTYERWLSELNAKRSDDAATGEQMRLLQQNEAAILGKVRGVESRLTKVAGERLAAVRQQIEGLRNPEGDSPDMLRVREALEVERQKMADAAAVGTPSPGMERAGQPEVGIPAAPQPEPIRGRAVMPDEVPARTAPEPVAIVPDPPQTVTSDAPRPVEAAPLPVAAEPSAAAPATEPPRPEPEADAKSLEAYDRLREETGKVDFNPPAEWRPTAEEITQARRVTRGWTPETELRRPQSLIDFVRKNGGLRLGSVEAQELIASDLGKQPGLLRRRGVQADWMAQRAADEGYRLGEETAFGSGVDVDAFVNALIDDASGRVKSYPEGHDTDGWRQQREAHIEFHNYMEDIGLQPKGMDPRQVAWVLRQEPEVARLMSMAERYDRLGDEASLEMRWALDGEMAKAEIDALPEPGAYEMADHRDLPEATRADLEQQYADYQRDTGADRSSEPIAEAGLAAEGPTADRSAEARGSEADRTAEALPRDGPDNANAVASPRDSTPLASPRIEGDSSLNRTASWIIRNKETGEVIMETFDKAKVDALNTAKYEAVPIGDYLGEINGRPRDGETQFSPRVSGSGRRLDTEPPGPALLDTREATAAELAARQRVRDKETAEALMRGKQRGSAGQEGADDLPLFGGDRQGTLLSPRITGENKTREYTPEQKAAFENVGRTEASRGIWEWMSETRPGLDKKFINAALDPYISVKENDPKGYIALRNAHSTAASFNAFLTEGTLKFDGSAYNMGERNGGVENHLVRPLGPEAHDFMSWVAANRAERLKAEDRENLFRPEDIAAMKSLNAGQLAFNYTLANGKTTRSREAAYMDSLKKLDTFNKNVLDLAVDSGLLTREDVDAKWSNPFYVPFYRQAETDRHFVGPSISTGFVKQNSFKTLKGGKERLNADLWENAFGNWEHLIDASLRNRAARQVLDTASAPAAGAARKMTAQEVNHLSDKELKAQTVWVMEDGKKVHYAVEDPLMLKAISALDQTARWGGAAMDVGRWFKRVLTQGITADPLFVVRNLIRDTEQSIAVAPLSWNIPKNLATGFKQNDLGGALQNVARAVANQELKTLGTSDEAASLMAGGGVMRMGYGTDTGARKMGLSTMLDSTGKIGGFWDYVSRTAKAYKEVTGQVEDVTRQALYKKLISEGVPHDEASFASRDLMDFTLRGTSQVVRGITDLVPFMNAWMQGLYKTGRAAADADRNIGAAVGSKVAWQSTKRVAYVLGTVAMLNLALDAIYADDPDYQRRDEYDRNSNFWFKVGQTEFRIPMGFEVAALARIAANGAEAFYDKEMTVSRFIKNTLSILGTNMSLNPTPQIVKPLLDIAANETRTGSPIEGKGMERLRSDERYTINNTLAARGASSALNTAARAVAGAHAEVLSPVQIDYLVQAYGGWLATSALGVADKAIRSFTSEPAKPEKDLMATITRGMIRNDPAPGDRYINMLYEQAKGIESAYASFQDMIKQGRTEDAEAFLKDNRELIEKHGYIGAVTRLEGELNRQIRLITNSPDRTLTPEKKKLAIMELQAVKRQAARSVFEARN